MLQIRLALKQTMQPLQPTIAMVKKHGSLINTSCHSLTSYSKQKESIYKISNRKEIKSNQKGKKSRLRKNNIFWKIIFCLDFKNNTLLLVSFFINGEQVPSVYDIVSTNCYSLDRRSLSDKINICTSLILYSIYILFIHKGTFNNYV